MEKCLSQVLCKILKLNCLFFCYWVLWVSYIFCILTPYQVHNLQIFSSIYSLLFHFIDHYFCCTWTSTMCSINSISRQISKGNKITMSKRYLHPYALCIVISNSHGIEITYRFTDRWMDKMEAGTCYIYIRCILYI